MKNLKITAIIEGKSGKIFLSEKVETMKIGMKRIVDIESEGQIKEPYRKYFINENGNKISFDAYTLNLQPEDNEDLEWNDFYKRSTGNDLPNNE